MNDLFEENKINFNKTFFENEELNNLNKISFFEDDINLDSFINNNLNNSSENINIGHNLTYIEKNKKNRLNICDKSLNTSYISIDSKNIFTKNNSDYIEEINKKINEKFTQNSESLEKIDKLSKLLKENFLEYLFPKKENNFFKICLYISKNLKNQKILKKEYMENYIEYFYKQRVYYKYAVNITINKNFINNCGPILCKIFLNLEKYKIKDFESLKNSINEIKNKNIKILNDFYIYCNDNKLDTQKTKKYKYLKSIRSKYILQPELIFFINFFHLVTKVSIDFDFEGEIITRNEIKLFIIVILCIKYLVKDLKSIKLNLKNRNLLSTIYEIYRLKLLINASKYNIFYKSNSISFSQNLYDEKWDFEKDFVLEFYKSLKKQNNFLFQEARIIFPILYKKQKKFHHKNTSNKKKIYSQNTKEDSKNDSSKELNKIIEDSIKRTNTYQIRPNNKLNIKKDELHYYTEFVNYCANVLELIFMAFFALNNMENLEKIELLFNESYYSECYSYFINVCEIEIGRSHILDLINNKLLNMNTLHFEINSFDLLSFNRILRIINNNKILSDFKFSFFSSDSSCLPNTIRKLNNHNIGTKLMKINEKENLDFKIEDIFFKNIFPYFERNLNYFFEILKNKNLKILGINFDIPPPILNDEKYIIIIFKFILNILLLGIYNKKSIIEKLIILSPNLIINGNKFIFFDKFLKTIHHNNKFLKSLSFQIKLYNISNIHKFVNNNLKILKIGELDLFSFKKYVENFTKFNFCKDCNLEELSISLSKTILRLDNEIKLIIAKLFNIYIKNLNSINLYTNIEINKEEFKDLKNVFENNWIPSYKMIFNKKSNQIIKDNNNLLNKIKYFKRKFENKNEEIKNDETNIESNEKNIIGSIFKYLKILFNKRYGKSLDFYEKKKRISNILKYICKSKGAIISFDLMLEENLQI